MFILSHIVHTNLSLPVLVKKEPWLTAQALMIMYPMTTSSPSTASAVHFTTPQKIAMILLLTANFTLAVDFSILNVALPHIGHDLGFTTASLQWIVTSFALCAAGFTLFFGRVADLFGRKRMFLIGISLLGGASLVGGLAQTPALLLGARIGQGLATAMVTPAALSLMTTMFPEGPARSRALGLNGALMAAGFTTGAVLGGVLTSTISWRWAFFINVVITVAVMFAAPFVLREPSTAEHRPKLDMPGAITITLALIAFVLGIDTIGHEGWASTWAWGPLVAAVILCVAFLVIESRTSEPLVAPALLKRSNIAWGNFAGLLAFATMTSLVFLLTLYLQEILNYSAAQAGLILGVLGIGTVIGGLMAPKIIARTNSRAAIIIGFSVQMAATLPLTFIPPDHTWLMPLLALTFIGGAANLVAIVGYNVASTTGVPADQQGLATGLITMSQQVGITIGTPLMSTIAVSFASASLLSGLQTAIGVNTALCLLTATLVLAFLRLSAATPD